MAVLNGAPLSSGAAFAQTSGGRGKFDCERPAVVGAFVGAKSDVQKFYRVISIDYFI
jgi:hypothetical protein